jgi:hypothetical protein
MLDHIVIVGLIVAVVVIGLLVIIVALAGGSH